MKKVNCTSISVDNDGMRRESVPQLLKEPYAQTCSNSRLIFCTRKQNIEYRKSMSITEQTSKERYTSLINLISLSGPLLVKFAIFFRIKAPRLCFMSKVQFLCLVASTCRMESCWLLVVQHPHFTDWNYQFLKT